MSALVVFNHCWELPLQLLVEGDLCLAHSMFGALLLPHALFRHKTPKRLGCGLPEDLFPRSLLAGGLFLKKPPFKLLQSEGQASAFGRQFQSLTFSGRGRVLLG